LALTNPCAVARAAPQAPTVGSSQTRVPHDRARPAPRQDAASQQDRRHRVVAAMRPPPSECRVSGRCPSRIPYWFAAGCAFADLPCSALRLGSQGRRRNGIVGGQRWPGASHYYPPLVQPIAAGKNVQMGSRGWRRVARREHLGDDRPLSAHRGGTGMRPTRFSRNRQPVAGAYRGHIIRTSVNPRSGPPGRRRSRPAADRRGRWGRRRRTGASADPRPASRAARGASFD
jgi:hypothetical protein